MNVTRAPQALLIIGALAALSPLLLSWLMIASGVYLGLPIDALVAFLFYLTGAFAVWQRPNHLAARRLLLVGAVLLSGLVIGRTLSLLAIWYGPITWFWLGSSLALAADLAFMSGLLGLFAVFPDGVYHHPYERWIVWAGWKLVLLVPRLLLLTRPVVFFNDYEVWPGPNVSSASPLYVSKLAWVGSLSSNLVGAAPVLCIVTTIILLALRYRRFEREQRLQITWPLLAAAGFGLAWIPTLLAEVKLVPRSIAI